MNFVRYPFFFVNSVLMIFGIIMMAYGILLLTNYSIIEDLLYVNAKLSANYSESFYQSDAPVLLQKSPAPRWLTKIRDPASYLLIGLGAAFFTLSFIGYYGSIKDSRGLMVIYGIMLGVIAIFQIIGIILYVKYKPDLKAEMATAVNIQYKADEFTRFEFILDLLMINYKCCGVVNEKDFKEAYSHVYSVRSLPIDPRNRGNGVAPESYSVTASPTIKVFGESEFSYAQETVSTKMKSREMDDSFHNFESNVKVESRVVTEQKERKVPVTCCKLNITTSDAVKLLRDIYRQQDNKLLLLDYAIDDACVFNPDEINAYVGDSHGCFDKIQGEISTLLRIGFIVIGLFELCGLVFAFFIFKTAYYGWLN